MSPGHVGTEADWCAVASAVRGEPVPQLGAVVEQLQQADKPAAVAPAR